MKSSSQKSSLTANEALRIAYFLRRVVTQVFDEQQELVGLVSKLETFGTGTTQQAQRVDTVSRDDSKHQTR